MLYRQFDGYLDGHGKELVGLLKGRFIVNGFSTLEDARNFNGIGCLAAQVVAHFKQPKKRLPNDEPSSIGNFYLYPANTRDCGEEYTYLIYQGAETLIEVKPTSGKPYNKPAYPVMLKIESGGAVLYDGPVDSLDIDALIKAEQEA